MPVVLPGYSGVNAVVLSEYSGVNAGGSLWVLQCPHRWFSLGTPVSIPVVLSGYSSVNTGVSLWVLRWFSLGTSV
jgi:hypothetical protein